MLCCENSDIYFEIDFENNVLYYKFIDNEYVQISRETFVHELNFPLFRNREELFFEFVLKDNVPCYNDNGNYALYVRPCNFAFHFVIDKNDKLFSYIDSELHNTLFKASEVLSVDFWKSIERMDYRRINNGSFVTFRPYMRSILNYDYFNFQEVIKNKFYSLFYLNGIYTYCNVIFQNYSFTVTVNKDNSILYVINNLNEKIIHIEGQFILLNIIKFECEVELYVKNTNNHLNIYYVGKEFTNYGSIDINVGFLVVRSTAVPQGNLWFGNNDNVLFCIDDKNHSVIKKMELDSEIPISKIDRIYQKEINGFSCFILGCDRTEYYVNIEGKLCFSKSELFYEFEDGRHYININKWCQYPSPILPYKEKLYGLVRSFIEMELVAKPIFDEIKVFKSGRTYFIICKLSTLSLSKDFYYIYDNTYEVARMLKYRPCSIENIGLTKMSSFTKTDGTTLQILSSTNDYHCNAEHFHVISLEDYNKKMVYTNRFLFKKVYDDVKPLPCSYIPSEDSVAHTFIMIGNLCNGEMLYGLVDKEENQILPQNYKTIYYINGYLVADNSVFQYNNKLWKLKTPLNSQLLSIAFGYIAFLEDGIIKIVNHKGKTILINETETIIDRGEYEDEYEESNWKLTFNKSTKLFDYKHEKTKKIRSSSTGWYSNQELKDMYNDAFGDNPENYWGND